MMGTDIAYTGANIASCTVPAYQNCNDVRKIRDILRYANTDNALCGCHVTMCMLDAFA